MRKTIALALGGLLLSAALSPVHAQLPLPPGTKEPQAEYALKPQHGPFMVYVASFRGEEAYELSHGLAQELREQYKMQAFIIRRVDRDAETERQRLLEIQARQVGEEAAMTRRRIVRVPDEYAVMVGHFADMKAAAEMCKKLKTMDRPTSIGGGIVMWRQRVDTPKPSDVKKLNEQRTNPFTHVFPTSNPLAKQQQRKDGSNPFQAMDWKEINKKEQYSLLQCPQPYTLVFKEFRSKEAAKLRPKQDYDPLKQNGKPRFATRDAFTFLPPIMDQADEALKEAEGLRGKGFPAYVLHLGETSYVTVGGYTGLRDPALAQTWAALKSKYGKETFLQNSLPTLMPVPGRDAPPLGQPVK